jgi:septum formation protein
MELILASASPRRKELLGLVNMPFTVQVAPVDETMEDADVYAQVAALSRRKAQAVGAFPGKLTVAADTVVVLDGSVLGKPADEKEAVQMLTALSGRTHQVMTGLTVLHTDLCLSHTEVTQVHFRKLSAREIEDYVATGDPMDKAGAYGIQSGAAVFVEGIEGDYYNVVGLPVCKLYQMIRQVMEEIK